MNIILQHYTGMLGELEKLSRRAISKYAEKVGAEYRLIQGNLFRENLTPPCQKLFMLNEQFDKYDTVVMLDIDMFPRKGMDENIFDVEGIGMYTGYQAALKKNMVARYPKLCDDRYAYWGGAIYKLTLEQRQLLRRGINDFEMEPFNHTYQDEGIMHRLACLARIKQEGHTLPGEFKWCHCSYRDGIENSAMIHIRPKVTPTGPKRSKIENYRALVERDLIEE